MKLPQTGGCQCGAVRYKITETPIAVYTCHCTACQRVTGTAFSMAALVADDAFHLSGAEVKPITRIADSGGIVTRLVCPDCGSWICNGARPDGRRVRAGTLDDVSWLRPTLHFWVRSKQPWVTLAEGDQLFETQPGS
jgi:hypothetical protein